MKILKLTEVNKVTLAEKALSLAHCMNLVRHRCLFDSLDEAIDTWKQRFPNITQFHWVYHNGNTSNYETFYESEPMNYTGFVGLRVGEDVLIWNGENDFDIFFNHLKRSIELEEFLTKIQK